MGQKDITEKLLEDYNDVFADIVNVLLFDGRQVVSPSALEPTKLRSQYKADDSMLHEMERDVAKNWTEEGVTLALYGMENEPSTREIKHVDAVLKMLSVFGGVTKFDDFVKVKKKKEKEVMSVGNVIDDMIDEGIRIGIEKALPIEVEKAVQIEVEKAVQIEVEKAVQIELEKVRTEYKVKLDKEAEKAAEKAVKEGESYAILNSVKQIQKNLNLTLEAALQALGTTMEAYEEAKQLVS